MKGVTGGIIDKDMPIHVSNMALFNPQTQEGRPRAASRRSTTAARCACSSRTAKWSTHEDGQGQVQDKADKAPASREAAADKPSEGRSREARQHAPMPPRAAAHYREKVVPELMKKFGYKTTMQVPRITKITLNMGVGEAVGDKKILDNAVGDMTKIAGQKPVVTKARKSIANFKVRDGYPDRLHGDAARRAHVRVPRPPGQHRDAAHPRLPRRVGPRLRRPRQLQPRRQGTDHLPRDRVRQDRRAPGHEHQPSPPPRRPTTRRKALLAAFRFPFKH